MAHSDPHLMSGTCVCGCDACMAAGRCVCPDCEYPKDADHGPVDDQEGD